METILLTPQWLDTSGTTYQGDKDIVILNSSIEAQTRQMLQEKAKGKVCSYIICGNNAFTTLQIIIKGKNEKSTMNYFLCKEHNTEEVENMVLGKVKEWSAQKTI